MRRLDSCGGKVINLKLLALGSCRIGIPLNHCDFDVFNTWAEHTRQDKNPKLLIGRSWSINEQLEMYKFLTGENDIENLVSHLDNSPGDETIKNNVRKLSHRLNDLNGLVVETSSVKYYKMKNRIIHNIDHDKLRRRRRFEHKLSIKECESLFHEFIEYVSKPIFFVSHFLHNKIKSRMQMWELINKVSQKYDNVICINPSEMWTKENSNDFLLDDTHYNKNGVKFACEKMQNIIKSYFK